MTGKTQEILNALGYSLLTLAAIVILGVIVMWIRSRWYDNTGPAESNTNLLLGYREMLRRGELTDEEYRLIKSRLTSRTGGNPLSALETGTTREAGPLHESSETKPQG